MKAFTACLMGVSGSAVLGTLIVTALYGWFDGSIVFFIASAFVLGTQLAQSFMTNPADRTIWQAARNPRALLFVMGMVAVTLGAAKIIADVYDAFDVLLGISSVVSGGYMLGRVAKPLYLLMLCAPILAIAYWWRWVCPCYW